MGIIKSVKKADLTRCRDAVTKSAVSAVVSGSRFAEYRKIDIHSAIDADVPAVKTGKTTCLPGRYRHVAAQDAVIDYIHTDVSGYKKADNNLTIEELFRDTRRDFR